MFPLHASDFVLSLSWRLQYGVHQKDQTIAVTGVSGVATGHAPGANQPPVDLSPGGSVFLFCKLQLQLQLQLLYLTSFIPMSINQLAELIASLS